MWVCCVTSVCTYIVSQLLLHGGGHHDDTDDGDQQEVEGVHDSGPRGLFDLGAAATAARAGRWAAAAGQLHRDNDGRKEGGTGKTLTYQFRNFPHFICRLTTHLKTTSGKRKEQVWVCILKPSAPVTQAGIWFSRKEGTKNMQKITKIRFCQWSPCGWEQWTKCKKPNQEINRNG